MITSPSLAHAAHRRQLQVVARSSATATSAERSVKRHWDRLLSLLADRPHFTAAHTQARRIACDLSRDVHSLLSTRLSDLARWSDRSAAWAILRTAPRRLLSRAMRQQTQQSPAPGWIHTPSWWPRTAMESRLLEDEGQGQDQETDLFGNMTDWQTILFPPPSEEFIRGIVYSSGWQRRLADSTRLASPDLIAGVVAGGLAQGKSQQEIAQQLLPVVDQVRSTAARIARTESLRVAHAAQMATHESPGDIVIGYQINATLDQHTRPEHRARDGTIYYRNPKPGQKGFDERPNPPHESPRDGNKLAWNCRCFLTPVLDDED